MMIFQFPLERLPEAINFLSQRIMFHLPEDSNVLKFFLVRFKTFYRFFVYLKKKSFH